VVAVGPLAACVAEHDWSSPPPGLEGVGERAAADLAAAARFHGVSGCVWLSLRHTGAGAVLGGLAGLRGLRGAYEHGLHHHLAVVATLARLGPALSEAGIPWLALKGPVLAEAVYARSDLRAYADLDLLVPPVWLGPAMGALEGAGCRVVLRNWDLARRRRLGQVALVAPGGVDVDLHWHPFSEPAVRAAFPVDVDGLFRRARVVPVAGRPVPTLSPADTLVHTALHAMAAGGNRLVWMKDVEQCVAQPLDWDEVVAGAPAWGGSLAVAAALQRASAALGFALPPGLLRSLLRSAGRGGRGWLAASRAVDRLAPVERATGHRSVARLVARATRSSTSTSVGAAVRAALRAPSARAWSPPATDADPTSEGSILHDAGGDEGRAAYLAEVAAAGRP
jgi:hypothetical protein